MLKAKQRGLPMKKPTSPMCVKSKDGMWTRSQELFGESKVMIKKRIRVIGMMKRNEDNQLSHFSYYEVLVSNREISKGIYDQACLRACLLERIKNLGSDEEKNSFTAQELRE